MIPAVDTEKTAHETQVDVISGTYKETSQSEIEANYQKNNDSVPISAGAMETRKIFARYGY